MSEDKLREELMGEGPNPDFKINYLIEAGAGAGKTYTMVHRILHQLVSGDREPQDIVAITFTEKATQEMVERLDKLLRKELEEAKKQNLPTVRRLEQLVKEAGRMQVSTIHSFCQTMLETMPFASPLGIEMKVEEKEGAVAREFFRRRYHEDDSLFAQARNRMGFYRDDLEDYFCERCKNREAELVFEPVGSAKYQTWEGMLKTFAGEFLEALQEELKKADSGVKENLSEELQSVLTMSKTAFLQDQNAVNTLARLRLLKAGKIPVGIRDKTEADIFRAGDGANMQKVWTENGAVLQDLTAKVAHSIVSQPTRQLLEEYREEKRKKHMAGFNDLLLRTRDMLRDNAQARAYFHERYKVLYVDEMQDTDAIQAEMLFFLTTDEAHFDPRDWKKCKPVPGSLFLVGDPKQAIYRFRGADIDIYNDVLRCFENGVGKVCKLKYNYRSVEGICKLSKAVFEEPDLTIPAKNGKTKDPEKEREKHFEWLNGGKYQAEYTDMEAKSKANPAKGRVVSYEPLGGTTEDYRLNDPKQVAAFIEAMIRQKPV
ncbi:MAG: UvrD-helicase domain-containing protein, partial [Firmicutes bacterium]|nr:UvrD-helicase domain-containing protein [Bacillota bacterium]